MIAASAAHAASTDLGDPALLTIKQAANALRAKQVTALDLTEACLRRIEKIEPSVNAFITVLGEQARQRAKEIAEEQRRGKWLGPLHGIPIAVKDNIDTAGIRTTAASGVYKDRVPSTDATVVGKLKAAGAVILGKTNLHEFAYGGTSDESYFGAVHNPWNLDHIAGGSSGGSAAAVSADLCFAALGTDTAGSVRIPSSYCGVVGFKPTYGRVSLGGVIPLSWTLDHVGPICKTVEDASLVLQAIAGFDPSDPASVDAPVPDYSRAMKAALRSLRVGVPKTFFENLDPEVADAVEAGLNVVRKLVGRVVPAMVPATFPLLLPTTGPEAYAYHEKMLAESASLYQPFTRDRIRQFAADVPAHAYADAVRQVNLLRRQIRTTFSELDVLITPTMPKPAESFADRKTFDAFGLQNTSPFNILGLPSISVPCGFTRSGLPIGLQISGGPLAEGTVLAIAHGFQRETEWHKRRPLERL